MKALKFIINGEEQEIPQSEKNKYVFCDIEKVWNEYKVSSSDFLSDWDVLVISIPYALWNEQITGFTIDKESSGLEDDIDVICCPYPPSSWKYLVGKIFVDKPLFVDPDVWTWCLFTPFERWDWGFPRE